MSLFSYQYRFVFIHIPKNAGSTFENNYSEHLPVGGLQHFEDLNRLLGYERDPALGNHFTWQMIDRLCEKHRVPIDRQAFFKFCVIRNPWERMVSLFEHRLRKIDRLTNGVPRNSEEDKALLRRGFETWLLETTNKSDKVLTQMPQLRWITDEAGQIVCDRIIRIENYDEEIREVVRQVGLPEIELSPRNINAKGTHSYRAYFSNTTRDYVAQQFREDIEAFGFEF